MSGERMGRVVRALAVSGLVAAAGCESGPSGPGLLDASVEHVAVSFGAAVLEVQGAGIVGFEPSGTSLVYWAAAPEPDRYRVVVVSPEGSNSIPFKVQVRELSDPLPQGTVTEASDLANNPATTLASFSVRVIEP